MMGSDHGWSGAVAFAAIAPELPATGPALVLGIAACAGAAVLPDIDHPDSTISRQFGFLTGALAWVVARVSGGHRHGTHSIAGLAAMYGAAAAVTALLGPVRQHPALSPRLLPAGLFLGLLLSAAVRALLGQMFLHRLHLARFAGHHADAAGLALAGWALWSGALAATVTPWHLPLLALATVTGGAAHIAGDMITHDGCPLAWPASRRQFSLLPAPFRITTDKLIEHWAISPALLAAFVWVLAVRDVHVPAPAVSTASLRHP